MFLGSHRSRILPDALVKRSAAGSDLSSRYALKTTSRALGPYVIDKRTTVGKVLAQWKADLVNDLAGPDALSTQQKAVVDLVLRQNPSPIVPSGKGEPVRAGVVQPNRLRRARRSGTIVRA